MKFGRGIVLIVFPCRTGSLEGGTIITIKGQALFNEDTACARLVSRPLPHPFPHFLVTVYIMPAIAWFFDPLIYMWHPVIDVYTGMLKCDLQWYRSNNERIYCKTR